MGTLGKNLRKIVFREVVQFDDILLASVCEVCWVWRIVKSFCEFLQVLGFVFPIPGSPGDATVNYGALPTGRGSTVPSRPFGAVSVRLRWHQFVILSL